VVGTQAPASGVDEIKGDLMPVPGITRVDHVGITVPDLDEAHTFFVDVLGFEYLYTLGPLRDDEGHWMSEHLDVDDRAVASRIEFFRIGAQAILEVFEYQAPGQRTRQPRNSDVGGHHLALYAEDLDAAVADLRRRGLRVLGEPTASKGPHEGQRWVYFLAPWGLQCELVSYPGGKAFERSPEAWRRRVP
jgi:catechol 2,3-dioxygenase-like lactoylglutathione lyase family enzyme